MGSAALGPPIPCQHDSYRSVLALGTVPGRLMSKSLRLMEEKRASVSPRAGAATNATAQELEQLWEASPSPAVPAPCGWRTPHPSLL